MNYVLLLATVLGTAAATGYALGTLVVRARTRAIGSASGPQALFLRALPGASGLLASLALALPAFLRYEPFDTRAWPGVTALTLGLAGLVLAKSAALRGIAAWRATLRLSREWARRAEPLALPGAPLPAFKLHDPFPVVAVVGIARPRLYVASQVSEALTPAEMDAVLAHEAGHLAARDNLKRLLLRFLPTAGWEAFGRRLEERWEAEAEAEADRRAGSESALELASALLKVARLAPAGARLRAPVAAFHTGDGVADRVMALLETPAGEPRASRTGMRARVLIAASAALAAAVLLPLAHALSEALIHLP